MSASELKRGRFPRGNSTIGCSRAQGDCTFNAIVILLLVLATNVATFALTRQVQSCEMSGHNPSSLLRRRVQLASERASMSDLVAHLTGAALKAVDPGIQPPPPRPAAVVTPPSPSPSPAAASPSASATPSPLPSASSSPTQSTSPLPPSPSPPDGKPGRGAEAQQRAAPVMYTRTDVPPGQPDFCDTAAARTAAAADAESSRNADTRRAIIDGQWDGDATWTASKRAALTSVQCHVAQLAHKTVHVPPIEICTHDPERDTTLSSHLHKWKWWGSSNDHLFILAAGYASGTPLQAEDAQRMRKRAIQSREEGQPFATISALSWALSLRDVPATDRVQSACSRERPVVLDVGANIGLFTLVAAATGCSVVGIEPMASNIGRLVQSVERNAMQNRVHLFKNAVARDTRLVTLDFNAGNPGATVVTQMQAKVGSSSTAPAIQYGEGGWGIVNDRGVVQESVATIVLDELFDGAVSRPRHPFLPRAIAPSDISLIKIDIEGFDAIALWTLRRTIELGRPPYIKLEYEPLKVDGACMCDNAQLIEWLYGLGYHAYAYGRRGPLSLEDFVANILPAQLKRAAPSDLPIIKELYLVHDSAPVPAVMNATGPGGMAPV